LHALTIEHFEWSHGGLVSLLLDIADGYKHEANFQGIGDRQTAKNRRSIAEKAFGVLCLRFFKTETSPEDCLWWWMLEEEVLFQKVLWFLRPGIYGGLHNFDGDTHRANTDHHQEVFRAFLSRFARLGWDFRGTSRRHWDEKVDEAVSVRLTASRPQLIDVLRVLGELNWLNRQQLDTASLKKLTDLAMAEHYSLPLTRADRSNGYRKPVNLKEAILGGSVPAQIVFLHRVREKQQRRMEALYKESCRQEEEARRQRELQDLARQQEALAQRAAELKKPPDEFA